MATREQIERDDPTFAEDLAQSDVAVQTVATWLRAGGHKVDVQPVRVRPQIDQMSAYSDHGDILLDGQRVEVKCRTFSFANRDAFPYASIMVDVCHAFDRSQPKPLRYYILSADLTGMIIIETGTQPSWIIRTVQDRKKKRERRFYECPLEFTRYSDLAPPVLHPASRRCVRGWLMRRNRQPGAALSRKRGNIRTRTALSRVHVAKGSRRRSSARKHAVDIMKPIDTCRHCSRVEVREAVSD